MTTTTGPHADRLDALTHWSRHSTLTQHRIRHIGPRPGTTIRLPATLGGGLATIDRYLPDLEAVVLTGPYYLAVSVHAITVHRPAAAARHRRRLRLKRGHAQRAGTATPVT